MAALAGMPGRRDDDGMKLELWAWASVALSVGLATLHALVALQSDSLAVTAEVIHNLADVAAALVVLAGLRLATRRSRDFPYGLYKLENLASLLLAGLIFLTAFEVGRDAVVSPPAVAVDGWMLAVLLVTTAVPLVFSHFELRAGRAANSPVLIADAMEYRVHVFTTGSALVALVDPWPPVPVDRLAALFIAAVVAWTGWGLLRDAMRVLLDASIDGVSMAKCRQAVESDPAVRELKWLTARSAGRFRFVEAGVTLRGAECGRPELAVGRIEAAVRAAVPHVERVIIQVEADSRETELVAVPLADSEGRLSEHFGSAPCFALLTRRRADGVILKQRVVTNPHRDVEGARGIRVAEWLVTAKVDVLVFQGNLQGKGPGYVLGEAGVSFRPTTAQTLADALELGRWPGPVNPAS